MRGWPGVKARHFSLMHLDHAAHCRGPPGPSELSGILQ